MEKVMTNEEFKTCKWAFGMHVVWEERGIIEPKVYEGELRQVRFPYDKYEGDVVIEHVMTDHKGKPFKAYAVVSPNKILQVR